MLADLLSPANYMMINKDAVKILGLNTAVYCSELLTIYKKVVKKEKFYTDNYFKVDREYIKEETSLSIEDQLKCDLNLKKVNIIKIDEIDPNLIFFDIEVFGSVLACEDIKLLDNVSSKVKVENPKNTKDSSRKYQIQRLKESVRCNTPEVLIALNGWIDSIMENPSKYMSPQQVQIFKDRLDDYCNGNLSAALNILEIATIHQYIDCQWAINTYEKNLQIQQQKVQYGPRITQQKQTTNLSEEVF